MTAPLRFGVLGCASIARRRLLPAMAAHPAVEIAAVASRDAGRAAAVAAGYACRPVTGYSAVLADETIDAVYVPLPTALHAEWVEAALTAGKHVLAEKPLSTDPAVTRRLTRLARSRGLTLAENVMFPHHSQHAAVRGLLEDNAIGELRMFQACFAIPSPPDTDIRFNEALGGGALWDVGVYPVRAALYFFGGGLDVVGAVRSGADGREVDISGAALMRAPGGVGAHLSFGLHHSYRSSYELWGSAGRIVVDRAFTPPADFAPVVRLETASGTRSIVLPPDDQVANALSAFVAAVGSGGTDGDEDVLAQADLLEEIRRAAGVGAGAGRTVNRHDGAPAASGSFIR